MLDVLKSSEEGRTPPPSDSARSRCSSVRKWAQATSCDATAVAEHQHSIARKMVAGFA